MRLWRRGWRNLWRNPGRTAIVVLLLGLAAGLFATMTRVGQASAAQVQALQARVQTFIEVSPAGSAAFEEGVDLFPEGVGAEVEGISHVLRADAYLINRMVDLQKSPSIAFFVGMAPRAPVRLAGSPVVDPPLIAGRTLGPGDEGRSVALVGQVYAAQAGVSVDGLARGERPVIAIPDPQGRPVELEVVGIFESGSVFGDNQVVLPLRTAQSLFGKPGRVSLVLVQVDGVDSVEAVAGELRRRLGQRADVVAADALARAVAASFRNLQAQSRLGAALGGILGAVVVFLTMVLLLHARTREIGLLKAIGASDAQVAGLLAAESVGLAVLGGLVGLALSAVATPVAVSLLGAGTELWAGLSPGLVVWTVAGAVTLALVGLSYPLLRALRMNPAEALRAQP